MQVLGLALVDNDYHSLSELDNQGTVFFYCYFFGHRDGYRVNHIVRGGGPQLRAREMIVSRSVARHPRGSYIVIPIAVSGVVTPKNKVTHWRSLALSSVNKKVGTRC